MASNNKFGVSATGGGVVVDDGAGQPRRPPRLDFSILRKQQQKQRKKQQRHQRRNQQQSCERFVRSRVESPSQPQVNERRNEASASRNFPQQPDHDLICHTFSASSQNESSAPPASNSSSSSSSSNKQPGVPTATQQEFLLDPRRHRLPTSQKYRTTRRFLRDAGGSSAPRRIPQWWDNLHGQVPGMRWQLLKAMILTMLGVVVMSWTLLPAGTENGDGSHRSHQLLRLPPP